MARDMTAAEFAKACQRNRFQQGPLGLVTRDIEGHVSTSYGYVLRKIHGKWRVWRRESLARAIHDRERDLRQAASSQKSDTAAGR